MRTYGRIYDELGNPTWVEVDTDANGFNDGVYLTTLCQVLLLNRGESPFYADYGIPAQQSIVQQVFPDYYVALTQQQFSGYFAALTVASVAGVNPRYRINATTQSGYKLNTSIPVPK